MQIVREFPSVVLDRPLALLQAPGDPDAWYVIEQPGRVKRFGGSVAAPVAEEVLDIRDQVLAGGERGLLGFAFHPDFEANGRVFLSYTDLDGDSVLARIDTRDGGRTWETSTLTPVLTVGQPYPNHNGGDVAFGPDGLLYWALGDGGSAGDPENRAQDLDSLLGKILRLDVDLNPYAVPPSNPFAGTEHRGEIYAYGLRNPFRMSFDAATGELWLGDVGQNAVEEVDRIEAGGNYGWRIQEGDACYATDPCVGEGLLEPVYAYAQDPGFSVMGGVVYRGTALRELRGSYLFTDYYHGRIQELVHDGDGVASARTLVETGLPIVHFTSGHDGEVRVLDRVDGRIFRIDPLDGEPTVPDFPDTLTATGCFETDGRPVAGLVPYEVAHPFWSDGATKRRWAAIPDGTQVTVLADGDLAFPTGTVLAKELSIDGTPVETRLFMNHAADGWVGYAYRWRADGSDADRLRGSEQVSVGDVSWTIPDPASCMQCHTAVAGRSLGLELGQLAVLADYPATGRRAPQLDTWSRIGWIDEVPDVTAWPASGQVEASVEDRARTYLHVNCSQCHRPDGPGRGELDLRRDTPLTATGLCAEPLHGDLGVAGARVIAPGAPARSVLVARMQDRGAYRMPPTGSDVVDDEGVALMQAWIATLNACR